jgi:hypothetical protein
VEEVVPAGWYAWTPTIKDFGPSESGDEFSYTFINSERVKVTACKLEDLDGDIGTEDDRVVLSGWPVYYSIGGVRQEPVAYTGVDGCYTWTNLVPGLVYDVEEDVMTGWINLTPTEHIFERSVSGGEYSYTFINYRTLGCTYTQGYWKTHSIYGPAGPYDPTWELKDGGDTDFLNSSWYVGLSWYEMFNTPPAGGNPYIILAHQYMAAWLSINNVDPEKAANPTVLGTAMFDAEDLLGTYTPEYDFKKDPMDVREDFLMLAELLDDFNNGLLGVPHCEE